MIRLIILLLCTLSCEAQSVLSKRYDLYQNGGDIGRTLWVDSNYIWVVFGTLPNGGISPPWATAIVKLDHSGNVIDTGIIHIPYHHVFTGGSGSLNRTSNGFVLGGTIKDSIENADVFLMMFYDNCDTMWTKAIEQPLYQSGWMAKQTSDGGFLVCGEYHVTASPINNDAHLLKTDSAGNLLWQRTYGDSLGSEVAVSFVETVNGGYALAGRRDMYDTVSMWIAIIDSSGTMQWDTIIRDTIPRNFLWDWDEIAWSIINTSDGNLLVTGNFLWQPQSPRPYYLKLDLNGNVLWSKTYWKAEGGVDALSTRELDDGSFISVGYHNIDPSPPRRAFLLKLDANGDSLWARDYYMEPHSTNRLYDVFPTPDGGFVTCGVIFVSPPDSGDQDLWILKVDSMGCEISNCTVSIEKLQEMLNPMKVFPVPFSSELNISINRSVNDAEIKVYNVKGSLLLQRSINGQSVKLNTSHWQDGIYVVQLIHKNELYTAKVIRMGN